MKNKFILICVEIIGLVGLIVSPILVNGAYDPVVPASGGGTGLSTVAANQLLIGNAGGTGWTQIATTSLGILSSQWTTSGTNIYYATGKVGIGTTSPFSTLSVSTTTQSSGLSPLFTVASTTNSVLFTVLGNKNTGVSTSTPSAAFSINGPGTGTGRAFVVANSSNVERLTVLDNGNIGIGSTTPISPLSVVGDPFIAGNLNLDKYYSYQVQGANVLTASSTTGNIFVGQDAGSAITSGTTNTLIGNAAFSGVDTGSDNVAIGFATGNGSADKSVYIGSNAGGSIGNGGIGNIYVGYSSGFSSQAQYNTVIGYQAGSANDDITGYNVLIGQNVDGTSSSATGQLNIGNLLFGYNLYQGSSGSGVPVLNGAVGVGTSTPGATFAIKGSTTTIPFYISTTTTTAASSTLFSVDIGGWNHYGGGTPVLSSCGTGPSLGPNSTDQAGTITFGSTATGCTLTFSKPAPTAPHCLISTHAVSLVNAYTVTESISAFTITQAASGGIAFDYFCPLGH